MCLLRSCAVIIMMAACLTVPAEAQWVRTSGPQGGFVRTFAASVNLDGSETLFAGTLSYGVFRLDDGATWTGIGAGLPAQTIRALLSLTDGEGGSILYAGTEGYGVFRSFDNGSTWAAGNAGLMNSNVLGLAAAEGRLFAATFGGGVFRSSDGGQSWRAVNTGLGNRYVHTIAAVCHVEGTTCLVAGTNDGVYLSTDFGASWRSATSMQSQIRVLALAVCPVKEGCPRLYAGTEGHGVLVTTDGGATWTEANSGLENLTVHAMKATGEALYIGTEAGIYQSRDGGGHWNSVDLGMTESVVTALAVHDGYLYAGTDGSSAWRRPLADMILDVRPVAESATDIHLGPCYPNPFNPVTRLLFSLPECSSVLLEICDLLGRRVATLADGMLDAGDHHRVFNGADLPSGVYLARMSVTVAGSGRTWTGTTRMILDK
jgi:photosystem II stability/assembly factor-like uncharacterized protein